jgi:hypothetical protein
VWALWFRTVEKYAVGFAGGMAEGGLKEELMGGWVGLLFGRAVSGKDGRMAAGMCWMGKVALRFVYCTFVC